MNPTEDACTQPVYPYSSTVTTATFKQWHSQGACMGTGIAQPIIFIADQVSCILDPVLLYI